MGKSADVEWMTSNEFSLYGVSDEESLFGIDQEHKEIIILAKDSVEDLKIIIHEINECELYHILKRWNLHEKEIKVTERIHSQFPKNFPVIGEQPFLSHILSPYGLTNSLILYSEEDEVNW